MGEARRAGLGGDRQQRQGEAIRAIGDKIGRGGGTGLGRWRWIGCFAAQRLAHRRAGQEDHIAEAEQDHLIPLGEAKVGLPAEHPAEVEGDEAAGPAARVRAPDHAEPCIGVRPDQPRVRQQPAQAGGAAAGRPQHRRADMPGEAYLL